MKVAIIGAGAVGLGMAALLCRDGHAVALWSPSGPVGQVSATGAIEGQWQPGAASDCASALADAAAVVIAVPGYGHRAVMDVCAPHLQSGQTVIVSSHMSFSALYLRSQCARHGSAPAIVVWGTTLVTGRKPGPGLVRVNHIRSRVDLAVLPATAAAAGLALCTGLFGDRFMDRGSLMAIALSNVNPQSHMAIALCNLTRMEKGESWKQYAHTTEAVGRLMQALDDERLALASALGVGVRTLAEHLHLSFAAVGDTVGQMAASLASRDGDPNGPATLDSRYVTEDVPFGLWPTVCLAGMAGVAAPLHTAGVDVFSALYGRDFRAENNILPALGPLQQALAAESPSPASGRGL